MNRKYLITLFLCCFSLFQLQAQNVIIKGVTENGEGKRVELIGYSDRISMFEQLLDRDTIKADSKNFTLKTSINYPTFVYLQIENFSQGFYIQPNRTYELFIPAFDWYQESMKNTFLYPDPLVVRFLNVPANDLNFLICTFDSIYAETLQKYSEALILYNDTKYLDSVKSNLNPFVEKWDDEYFKLYSTYRLAEVEYSSNPRSRKKLWEIYFNNKPILYQHIGYMDFFNLYFDHFYTNGTKKIAYYNVERWVNENQLFQLIDSLGVEPMLQNEILREMVMLKGLNEAFYMPGFSPSAILSLLKTFANETRFPEHKKIAENIGAKVETKYKPFEVKNIILPDVNKNMVSLEQFKGKWVYVSFVKIREAESLRELETMSFFQDTLCQAGNFEFLTIDCDKEFLKMYHFLENTRNGKKYNWTWLHFDNDYALLERFQIGDYPSFALINPQGKVILRNAPTPADGFLVNPYWIQPKAAEEELINPFFPFQR